MRREKSKRRLDRAKDYLPRNIARNSPVRVFISETELVNLAKVSEIGNRLIAQSESLLVSLVQTVLQPGFLTSRQGIGSSGRGRSVEEPKRLMEAGSKMPMGPSPRFESS